MRGGEHCCGGQEATLVTALYYCCKCDVNLSNQCSLTPPGGGWRCGSGGQEPGWSIRSIHCRGCHHRARAAAHQPAVQTPVSQLLSSSHCHHETPAVATPSSPGLTMMGADSAGRRLLFPRVLPRPGPGPAPVTSGDHDKKRRIAVKCLELEEMLERQGWVTITQ